jgi:hypothetical protein
MILVFSKRVGLVKVKPSTLQGHILRPNTEFCKSASQIIIGRLSDSATHF